MNTFKTLSVLSEENRRSAIVWTATSSSVQKLLAKAGLRMQIRKCSTLIEVLIVILIVAILASVAVAIIRGKANDAKWSEAKAAAGTIRTAVITYAVEKSVALTGELVGSLAEKPRRELLGFQEGDLMGSYFVPGDYNIDAVNERGNARITITASTQKGPTVGESITLMFDGTWVQ